MNEKRIAVSENLEKLALKLKSRADIFLVGGDISLAKSTSVSQKPIIALRT